jgi:hypothetical protein
VVRLSSEVGFANVGSYRKGSHHIVPAEMASLKRVLKRTRRQCVKDDRRRVVVFVVLLPSPGSIHKITDCDECTQTR